MTSGSNRSGAIPHAIAAVQHCSAPLLAASRMKMHGTTGGFKGDGISALNGGVVGAPSTAAPRPAPAWMISLGKQGWAPGRNWTSTTRPRYTYPTHDPLKCFTTPRSWLMISSIEPRR
jgi:hypothetical protein